MQLSPIPPVLLLLLLLFTRLTVSAQSENYLQTCWNKQVKPLREQTLHFSFQEKSHELEHSFEPWQQSAYASKGSVWMNETDFLKSDTLTDTDSNRFYYSVLQQNSTEVLLLDYGQKELSTTTKSMVLEQPLKTARYNPAQLINYIYQQNPPPDRESSHEWAVYKTTVHKTLITIYIRKSDRLLQKVTTLHDDELFGDVTSTFTYKDYTSLKNLRYPRTITVEKINGKLKDEIRISTSKSATEIPAVLQKPSNYIVQENADPPSQINIKKHGKKIHLMELTHTDDNVMLVEFNNFLLVAEAPLNSKNGELIIQEAAKIAPNKPIKYFVFGHYHPHYLGGIRPFIHKEARIICTPADQEYVRYIASAPRTLNPDKLHLEPKPVLFEEVKDSLTITDGSFEMKIYFIGNKSQHTNDYLIYYFPSEKLLFEDDLVWIAREGDVRKASARQAGLYNAIKELGLTVETIIQSWPVADYGVKTVIPFSDLEKSMTVK